MRNATVNCSDNPYEDDFLIFPPCAAIFGVLGTEETEMTDSDALLAIQEAMDGVASWSSDTLEEIARIMVAAGYRIRDCDDCDYEEGEP